MPHRILLIGLLCLQTTLGRAADAPRTVMFVCEHGTVKSLIAASFFNRWAAEQGLNCRAVARGTAIQAEVPAGVAANLRKDGFDLAGFRPQAAGRLEAESAAAVIAFCELPPELAGLTRVQSWTDVPPASVDYEKAKAVMLPRIEALLAGLRSP
jgi:protein-tyrosine-phosphatase